MTKLDKIVAKPYTDQQYDSNDSNVLSVEVIRILKNKINEK